jgi:hypothetical protein
MIKTVDIENILKAYSINKGRKRGETITKILRAFNNDIDYIKNELLLQRAKIGGREKDYMKYQTFVEFFDQFESGRNYFNEVSLNELAIDYLVGKG